MHLGFRGKLRALYGTDPAVAVAFNGLNKDWVVGGIAQRISKAFDGAADASVEIYKDVARPKRLA